MRRPPLKSIQAKLARVMRILQQMNKALWQLVNDQPLCEDAYASLFQMYLNKGDAERGIKVARTWWERDPLSINGRILKATVLLQAGDTRGGEGVLNELFSSEPDNGDVLIAMNDFYTRTHKLDEYVAKLRDKKTKSLT